MVIKIGDPVTLLNTCRLMEDRLYVGQKGFATNIVNVDGEEYILFLPHNVEGIFVAAADRFELDVEEKKRVEEGRATLTHGALE